MGQQEVYDVLKTKGEGVLVTRAEIGSIMEAEFNVHANMKSICKSLRIMVDAGEVLMMRYDEEEKSKTTSKYRFAYAIPIQRGE